MANHENVTLVRDCEATEIPFGHKTKLVKGTDVTITQALGDTFTVMTAYGGLARIEAKDADALGKNNPPAAIASAPVEKSSGEIPQKPLQDLIWDQLRSCYDPEIPVNIVDLGLIYKNQLDPLPGGQYKVSIDMTLTAPGCGMGDIIKGEAEGKIRNLPGVAEVCINMIFEPQWDRNMMSDAAKLELGIL